MNVTGGNFKVTDINGRIVFKTKGQLLTLHNRRILYDVTGMPISMKEKVSFNITLIVLFYYNCLTTATWHWLWGKSQVMCDFKVKGSWLDRSCVIYHGDSNTIIAQVRIILRPT
ncbi:hypothetical protein GIB67_037758 [Kingdonia uniflora]|uniref:Uncharacterized protein n=1 Tax=Kingdonia uniflora TaxID=39325 RepID=A0A7J7LV69_9MAGN|nr:hypothetical protein GIB67_037758 [Kingdonia uniflora]